MQAEAGNKLCLKWKPWELKQGEDVCCHRVLPHSHPQPVLPAGPAWLLVELIVPLRVVQGVAPELQTFLTNFRLTTLQVYSSLSPALLVQT